MKYTILYIVFYFVYNYNFTFINSLLEGVNAKYFIICTVWLIKVWQLPDLNLKLVIFPHIFF